MVIYRPDGAESAPIGSDGFPLPRGAYVPHISVTGEGSSFDRSRGNSSKLGLSGGCTVLPKDFADEVNHRFNHFSYHLRPFDTFDMWLCEVITIDSVRYDQCQRHLTALQNRQTKRAETHWEEDQATEAERIAERLPKAPRRVMHDLLAFKAGAGWVQMRWRGLANVVQATGEVSDAQRSTALDLLGVPGEVRQAATPLDLAGKTPAESLIEVAEAEIRAMETKIASE